MNYLPEIFLTGSGATARGFEPGFGVQWLKSCATTWPVAFPTVTLVAPWVRRIVGQLTIKTSAQ